MSESIIKPENKMAFPWKLGLIFLLFTLAIIFTGIYYYEFQKKRIFSEQEINLSAIASVKIGQFNQWHSERIGDASIIRDNDPFILRVRQYFRGEYQTEIKRELKKWMESFNNTDNYSGVLLLDSTMKVRFSVSISDSLAGDAINDDLAEVKRSHRIIMTDIYKDSKGKLIHIDVLVPLLDPETDKNTLTGIVVLRIDPWENLFPLIQSWPTSSKSSETLLLRKERDSVLYLNELRHLKNSAFRLKLPVTDKNLLAAKAVNGFEGLTEGTDYRNVPVVGSIYKVPGTTWYMVAKVDKEEILSPLRKYVFFIIMVVTLLVLITASIFGFSIWEQRLRMYRLQLKDEIAIRESEERFTTAFRMSPVSVTISSLTDNRFIDVNNTFLSDMGYKREEVIGRTPRELNIWADENERQWIIKEIEEKGRIFGKVISYLSKTGKIIYGLSSMSVVHVNGEPCNLSTVVNITESKKAEIKLLESEELFRKLFANMLNGFAYCKMINDEGFPLDFIYITVNEAFVLQTGLKDVIGKKVSEVIPGIQETDPELIERYNRVSMTGIPEVFETYVGSLKMWFAISLYSPQKGYFVAVFDVITARKIAEEELRESETKFRQTFDMSPIGIVMVGLDKNFLRCNASFSKSLGYQMEELVGKTIDEVTFPEDINIGMSDMKDIAEGKSESSHVQKRYLSKDGRIVWGEVLISLIRNHLGNPLYFLAIIQDITESKKVIEALRESEDKFKYIFDHSVAGKSITFPSGEIHVNRAFCEMTGYSPEELANTRWQDISYPADIRKTEEELQSLISGEKKSTRFIKRYIHKNGDIVWADVGTSLRRDENGKPLYFMTTAINITDWKLAEEALSESEERFSKSFMTSPISFMIANMDDGRIIEVNDAFTTISGFTRDEALTSTTLDLKIWVNEQDRENLTDSLRNGKAILHRETLLRGKNGNISTVLLSAQLIKLGNRNCIISSIEDITRRKEAEAEVRIQSEIMSNMAEAVYLVRMADGIIVFANSRFEELFGYESGEMIGKPVSIVNAPTEKRPEETAKEIMSVLVKDGFWTGEVLNIRKEGTVFWSKANVTIFDHSKFGKVLVSVQEDITDRKNAEFQIKTLNEELEKRVIQRTEQLEAANKELEAFSYSVSHDLRAPLRAVHGYSKILLEDYEDKLDAEGKRVCNIISSSATQMGELIDDLLSFSRIGRSKMNAGLINMKSIAGSVFEEIAGENINGRINFKNGNLHKVYGDQNLIKHVWNNLISNAIKYSSKEKVSEISVGSKIDGEMITYFVKDNGVGFDMQYAHKLFGVFQRLHNESDFEGNGVGLAIVQRIIFRHGGKVWAESEVGKGATFYFSLPVRLERQK